MGTLLEVHPIVPWYQLDDSFQIFTWQPLGYM